MKTNKQIQQIVLSALGIAIVFVATILIRIPNAMQGYVNMGDGLILLFASFLSPALSFLVGGLGSGLADIAGGYGYYFIFTLIIKGLEGFIVAYLLQKKDHPVYRMFTYLLGSLIMIGGYFIADTIVNQSIWLGAASIWGNLFQAAIGFCIGIIGYPLLQKVHFISADKVTR